MIPQCHQASEPGRETKSTVYPYKIERLLKIIAMTTRNSHNKKEIELHTIKKEKCSPEVQGLPCKHRSRDRCCDSIACYVDYFVTCGLRLLGFIIRCGVVWCVVVRLESVLGWGISLVWCCMMRCAATWCGVV